MRMFLRLGQVDTRVGFWLAIEEKLIFFLNGGDCDTRFSSILYSLHNNSEVLAKHFCCLSSFGSNSAVDPDPVNQSVLLLTTKYPNKYVLCSFPMHSYTTDVETTSHNCLSDETKMITL